MIGKIKRGKDKCRGDTFANTRQRQQRIQGRK